MTKLGEYWLLKIQWNLVADATTTRGFSGVVSALGGLLYVSLARTATTGYGYEVKTDGVASCSTNSTLISSKQPLRRSFSGINHSENAPPHF